MGGSEPTRTCIGCRARDAKGALLRVVRQPDGSVAVDRSGGAPGRGAYVHAAVGCIETATRRGALVRALRTGIGPDELGRLRDDLHGANEQASSEEDRDG